MKSNRHAVIFVAIGLALLAVISAYLAYSQANILDRYLKRLLVEPDLSQFEQNNTLIILFSIVIWVGQYFCWWLMGKWLLLHGEGKANRNLIMIPIAQIPSVYKLAMKAWGKYEYLEKEADEFHQHRPWSRFSIWFWTLLVAMPLMVVGAIWLFSLPPTPAVLEVASNMSYALTILTVGHALAALGLLFTIAVSGQLEARENGY